MDNSRDLARSHLLRYGSDAVPTDVVAICHALGIRLLLTDDLDRTCRGAAIHDLDGYTAIVLNERFAPADRTYTLAHELGHIALEHTTPRRDWQERLADEYATELVLPLARLRLQLDVCTQPLALARWNAVPIAVVAVQLGRLAEPVGVSARTERV